MVLALSPLAFPATFAGCIIGRSLPAQWTGAGGVTPVTWAEGSSLSRR
jgi:hypothetical protein